MTDAPPHQQSFDPRDPDEARRVVREFASLYWTLRDQTLGRTRWLGMSIVKTPMDMMALQEVVAETRPTLIIETGVFAGGSTLYLASLLDLLDIEGTVLGVDVDLTAVSPHIRRNPRIELIEGSSVDPRVIGQLEEQAKGHRVMVDLDADHSAEHVRAELEALSPLVTPGCYLVVEDTWLGGRPVPDEAPGPGGALEGWLAEGQPFEVDSWRERFLLTGNPRGYLRREDPEGRAFGGPPRLDRFTTPSAEVTVTQNNDSDGGHSASIEEERRLRSLHQDEYDSLRAYVRQLEAELEALRSDAETSGERKARRSRLERLRERRRGTR